MYCDARQSDDGMVAKAAVCIIGGGAAGITMAREFERRGIDTILLESGGFRPDSDTMDLYRGENVGIPYEFGDGFRSRLLGGGSNCWGGWCRPLDAEDLQHRDWVPHSGWPPIDSRRSARKLERASAPALRYHEAWPPNV